MKIKKQKCIKYVSLYLYVLTIVLGPRIYKNAFSSQTAKLKSNEFAVSYNTDGQYLYRINPY